ncbi:hypothetical protein [Paenibacillus sp. FSL R10-2778]|uniref:hypothetical protein n=1 Tax=Paenibacillus sp. FSL R10-2778 TaxID=2954659 RepID=UPI0031584235
MNDRNLIFVAKAKMMLVYPLLLALIVILVVSSLTACDNSTAGKTASKSAQPTKDVPVVTQASGSIYLYGEVHGQAKIIDKKYELWSELYHNEGMRHLFVELPYFTAEYLNLWMQSDNDDILEEIYDDWERTRSHNPDVKEFYKKIKSECPETIFHGTDIGRLEIHAEDDSINADVIQILKKIHVPGEVTTDSIIIYGYNKTNEFIDYI